MADLPLRRIIAADGTPFVKKQRRKAIDSMSKDSNIDRLLTDWPYDPDSVSVRIVKGDDERDVIQMRLDMGVLQLETTGRPDGARPNGSETYFDFLLAESVR